MVKVRTYGALMGALLTIAGAETAEAAECNCVPTPPKHQAVNHPAPRAAERKFDDGHAYAQSGYDYRSASRVTESFVRHAVVQAPVMAPVQGGLVMPPLPPAPAERFDDGFRVAPADARIRFYRDEKVLYVPAYPPQPMPYYPPPPPAYYQGGYQGYQGYQGYAAPMEGDYDQDSFSGGVGYGAGADAGGGGYGGMTAYLYNGQSGSDAPPNGGGVSLQGGYGPSYLNAWQTRGVPTRGGLAGH